MGKKNIRYMYIGETMQCDMCGKETPILYETIVESVKMYLCKSCSRYGKVIRKISSIEEKPKEKKEVKKEIKQEEEIIEVITQNYATLIKNAREKRGLKQKELAKMIAEKESIIHKIEASKIEPPIDIAKKLERVLGIKLVEQVVEKHQEISRKEVKELTLGDIAKLRRRTHK